jgi:hypothetical protein
MNESIIAEMKQWCEDNYSNGADTMVECWSHEDYANLFVDCDGNPKTPEYAWHILKSIAEVYADRQADARYYRENY